MSIVWLILGDWWLTDEVTKVKVGLGDSRGFFWMRGLAGNYKLYHKSMVEMGGTTYFGQIVKRYAIYRQIQINQRQHAFLTKWMHLQAGYVVSISFNLILSEFRHFDACFDTNRLIAGH